jgi:hypothetical protein
MRKIFHLYVIAFAVTLTIGLCTDGIKNAIREQGEHHTSRVDQWQLQSYQFVMTLQDEDWVEIRRADGTIVGQVQCDTTTNIGKLLYKENE